MKMKCPSAFRFVRVVAAWIIAASCAAALPAATVTVNSSDAVNRPFVGFGINWHPYWDKPSTQPAAALSLTNDEWQTVYSRLNYLNFPVMRVMILPEWVNPTATSGGNNYNTAMMNALYKVLDYAKAHNITVAFGFWDARAPFNDDEGSAVYIQTATQCVDHLVNARDYTNINYFILANEPQHRFANYTQYRTALQNLFTSFSNAGLLSQMDLMGPDVGNDGTSWLGSSAADLDLQIGSYEWHYYPTAQTGISDGSPGPFLLGLMNTITTNDPTATIKPLVLTEMGSFYGVVNDQQQNIGTVSYAMDSPDLGMQAARNGWSSVAWYLDDQTNDKLWGMWDIKNAPALRPWFYTWSLLSRNFPEGMTLYRPAQPSNMRVLVGKRVISGSNRWSIALLNRNTTAQSTTVTIPGESSATLRQYTFVSSNNVKDGNGFPLPTGTVSGNLGTGVTVSVPASSMVVLTNLPTTISIDDRQVGAGTQQWSYAGSWGASYGGSLGEFNTTNTSSRITNDTATIQFVGTQVKLYGKPGPGGGHAGVRIDGGTETTGVSFYSATATGNQLIWTSGTLSSGTHTLVVRVTGTKPAASSNCYIPIDRIEIIP